MATSLVDNLAVRALHERILSGLSSGAAPWFSDVLRRPEEIGDLSNAGRRKMPALMRNADGRAGFAIKAFHVVGARPKQPAQVGFLLAEQAVADLAVSRQPGAVAGSAERLGHARDDAHLRWFAERVDESVHEPGLGRRSAAYASCPSLQMPG